jgi:hypothetical protein
MQRINNKTCFISEAISPIFPGDFGSLFDCFEVFCTAWDTPPATICPVILILVFMSIQALIARDYLHIRIFPVIASYQELENESHYYFMRQGSRWGS